MKYQSIKHPDIYATLDSVDKKCGTTMLVYDTGEKQGTAFTVSNSTLRRWWKEVKDENEVKTEEVVEEPSNPLNIDFEQVNKPYKPDVTPHYIEKPASVIEYESKKRGAKKSTCEFNKPENYEALADVLAEHFITINRINSGYITLSENSKLKLQLNGIALLASQNLGEKFVERGFQAKACIEKGTPFRFDFHTQKEYDDMLQILSDYCIN